MKRKCLAALAALLPAISAQAGLGDSPYVAIDLSGGADAKSYPVRFSADGPDLSGDACRTTELWLRLVPAGTFTMGSPPAEPGRSEEETQHEVTISKPFYVGVFETTQKQWMLVMGTDPSKKKGDARPVESVSYDMLRGAESGAEWPSGGKPDADSFFGRLRARTELAFDLPTEAQWEYACRAGTTTSLNNGTDLYSTGQDDEMQEVGRYSYNRGDKKGGYSDHTKVGSYVPNAWGLYDMLGNVQEWCLDLHGDYGTGAQTDPAGASSGPRRVCRGGSYHSTAGGCRSAARNRNLPSVESSFVGFRPVVLLPEGQ